MARPRQGGRERDLGALPSGRDPQPGRSRCPSDGAARTAKRTVRREGRGHAGTASYSRRGGEPCQLVLMGGLRRGRGERRSELDWEGGVEGAGSWPRDEPCPRLTVMCEGAAGVNRGEGVSCGGYCAGKVERYRWPEGRKLERTDGVG